MLTYARKLAYVSIHQHTPAYGGEEEGDEERNTTACACRMLPYADVC
jgi:hypothetical protein